MRAALILAVASMLVLAPMARADWDTGDPYKMHFPQLPNNSGRDMSIVLADDWECIGSGPVNDIHFWTFFDPLQANVPVYAMICSNIPDGGLGYSIPGPMLWDRYFYPGEYTVRFQSPFYWQFNIEDIRDAFVQTEGQIYWLGLRIQQEPWLYWNFSDAVFMDQATMWTGEQWELLGGNMAFVITPEPATLCLLGIGAVGMFIRRRGRK